MFIVTIQSKQNQQIVDRFIAGNLEFLTEYITRGDVLVVLESLKVYDNENCNKE